MGRSWKPWKDHEGMSKKNKQGKNCGTGLFDSKYKRGVKSA